MLPNEINIQITDKACSISGWDERQRQVIEASGLTAEQSVAVKALMQAAWWSGRHIAFEQFNEAIAQIKPPKS